MTALALPAPASSRIVSELFERQPTLARYGAALLLLALGTALLQQFDARTLDGVNVWVKPTKFLVSVGVFALTTAWFFGYVRPERRRSRAMGWTVAVLLVSATFELAWISWQAAQGLDSHFNTGTPFYAIMFALMGLFALALTGTTLPLAWEIARRPAEGLQPDYVLAVVLGLVLTFLLGTGAGAYMSAHGSHDVGAEGARLALFGWNREGGDLRIAHFMGIHAQQAIPLLGGMLGLTALPRGARTRWLLAGTALFTAATLVLFAQAVSGRPLLPA
jgi:hypothetical protein